MAFFNAFGLISSIVLYFTVLQNFWLCILFFFVWAAITDTILSSQFKRADSKRRRQSPANEEMAARIAEFDDYRAKHTLLDRFNPNVSKHIEACAVTYDLIIEGIESTAWRAKNQGSEWQRVAEQARGAADKAMVSAVAACAGGYRPKGMPRKVWQKMVDDDPDCSAVVSKLEAIEADLSTLATALGVSSNAVGSSIANVLASMEEIRRAEEELDGSVHT